MGLKYKVSDKELLEIRNKIFKEEGIPGLLSNGFEADPYKTSWHGEYDKSIQGYIYQFSRLTQGRYLERIQVYIMKGEKWIQIFLNVFELNPNLDSLAILKNLEGLGFSELSYRKTRMRLRIDDFKGMPLFRSIFFPEHRLGDFYTENGYISEINKLSKLIRSDMQNINDFVKKWHELFSPNKTDWEGNSLKKDVKKI